MIGTEERMKWQMHTMYGSCQTDRRTGNMFQKESIVHMKRKDYPLRMIRFRVRCYQKKSRIASECGKGENSYDIGRKQRVHIAGKDVIGN